MGCVRAGPLPPVWEAVAEVLRREGYSVDTGLLAAEEFGVPQTRSRAILVAKRSGTTVLPTPTYRPLVTGRRTRACRGSRRPRSASFPAVTPEETAATCYLATDQLGIRGEESRWWKLRRRSSSGGATDWARCSARAVSARCGAQRTS
ncbi:DNA cytosine methyltransferase [Amycolatopsis sp. NPDC051371]|uniref:DNA cytosine methyltransferase n=1 Tax=Amycolatopsis sp. NPDC051371 TaxID=3155800 RepID=UPI003447A537